MNTEAHILAKNISSSLAKNGIPDAVTRQRIALLCTIVESQHSAEVKPTKKAVPKKVSAPSGARRGRKPRILKEAEKAEALSAQ